MTRRLVNPRAAFVAVPGLRGIARVCAALACLLAATAPLRAQTPIRDLVIDDEARPVRLVGYGLVVGLDNTGDNGYGRTSEHTVQSVANLLRKFDISVPAEYLRTRNVAAVLVTAEVSPYLRPGGRFEIQIASVGNARSLRGGVLWQTPLLADVGGEPLATAQGPLTIGDGLERGRRSAYSVSTSARIPDGGLVEGELPRPQFASVSRLLLRQPDLGTAARIAAAIDTVLGAGTAKVDDPGAIALTLKEGEHVAQLARIRDLTVTLKQVSRIVIDGREGTVVAGGEVSVGPGIVSVGDVTLSIGGPPADTLGGRGSVQLAAGTSVQALASALHRSQMPPSQIAMVFEALRRVGAISAEVVTR